MLTHRGSIYNQPSLKKTCFLFFYKVLILVIYSVFFGGTTYPAIPQNRRQDPPVTAVELVFLIQMKNDTLMPDCHSNQYLCIME